jgi:hypothetical protein
MKIVVLVVDKDSLLTVSSGPGARTLPSESLWPLTRKKPRTLFPNLLIEHILFGSATVPKAVRQSNIFGLDKKISWYLIQTESIDNLVKKSIKIQKWFQRHAFAKTAWKLQCTPFDKIENLCDIQTIHCVKSFLKEK